MPFNGSGVFNRLYSWVADAAAGIDISPSRMDADTNDIVGNGLSLCLTVNGQSTPTENLPMGGFRHTNAGNGVAASDYATMGQMQAGTANWNVAGGSSDAITVADLPAITALIDGQVIFFRASAANTTTTPTLNVNSLGAQPITKTGGNALAAGDIPGNYAEVIVRYNLGGGRWELLNPAPPAAVNTQFLVQTGTMHAFAGSAAPSGYMLCYGQAVSRTTYAALFAAISTAWGNGDGSTTFNVPDLRGRVLAGLDNMGGTAASRLTGSTSQGVNATTLGASGGEQAHTQITAEIATHAHGVNDGGHTHANNAANVSFAAGSAFANGTSYVGQPATINTSTTGIAIQNQGSSQAFNVVQPTIAGNWIIKI